MQHYRFRADVSIPSSGAIGLAPTPHSQVRIATLTISMRLQLNVVDERYRGGANAITMAGQGPPSRFAHGQWSGPP
jgi:hypothetical protein